MIPPAISDNKSMVDYMSKYIVNNFRCLEVPRLLERANISNCFGDWDASVRKKTLVRPVFIFKGDGGYGKHYDSPLPFLNIYSSNIYPHYVVCDKGQAIVWDSHYWDLFSFFLMVTSDIIFFREKYDSVWNAKKSIDFLKTKNLLNSLMLLYLTHRYESDPVLSYLIAEMYSQSYSSIPAYNLTFALPDNKKVYCNAEEYLDYHKLLWITNFAKQFVCLHECTHVKMRTQPSERKIECQRIVNYCNLFNLYNNIDVTKNSDCNKHFITEICDRNNIGLAEEVFCDINALTLLYEAAVNESLDTTKAMLSADYLLSFQYWLKIIDAQWKTLTNVLKEPLTEASLRKIAPNLEREYMLANARQNIAWSIFNFEAKGKIDPYERNLDWEWFTNIFLTNDDCYDMIDSIMIKYRRIKGDSKHSKVWREDRNKLIGWKDGHNTAFA